MRACSPRQTHMQTQTQMLAQAHLPTLPRTNAACTHTHTHTHTLACVHVPRWLISPRLSLCSSHSSVLTRVRTLCRSCSVPWRHRCTCYKGLCRQWDLRLQPAHQSARHYLRTAAAGGAVHPDAPARVERAGYARHKCHAPRSQRRHAAERTAYADAYGAAATAAAAQLQ